MKYIYSITSFFLLSAHIINAEGYILDKKNHLPAVGSVWIDSSSFHTVSNAIFSQGDKVQNMKMVGGVTEITTRTILTTSSFKEVLTKKLDHAEITVDGKKMPGRQKETSILLNVGLIYSWRDGMWSVRGAKGKLDTEQRKEASEQLKYLNVEQGAYGYVARNIGDKWAVKGKQLSKFVGSGIEVKGSAQIHFVGVENFKGEKCAKLKWTFDLTGENERGQNLTNKGSLIEYRSLKHLVEREMSGTTEISLKGGGVEAKGPVTYKQTINKLK